LCVFAEKKEKYLSMVFPQEVVAVIFFEFLAKIRHLYELATWSV
jgi:hypothetical protein